MKCKAKRLDSGEWVEGNSIETDNGRIFIFEKMKDGMFSKFEANKKISINHIIGHRVMKNEIDPTTLCQQARGTEFFEGDEMIDRKGNTGYLYYDHRLYCWSIDRDIDKNLMVVDVKPTGKNIHDEKAN